MMGPDQPKNKASSFFGLIFVLLILVLVASLIGFFYFTYLGSDNQGQGVNFWLYRHASQIAGQESTFFIFIKNQENHNLNNIEAVLNFPHGFVLNSSVPECHQVLAHGCIWVFDSLKKKELKEIELKGQVFGQADKNHFFNGYLNFSLEGFSSEFQKTLASSVMLKSPLALEWEIPEKSSFSDEIKSTIYLESITNEIIPQIQIIIDWPEDFVLETSTGDNIEIQRRKHQLIWRVANLSFSDKKKIEFNGYLKSNKPRILVFKTRAGLINNEDFFVQTEQKKSVAIDRFDFDITLKLNDSIEPVQSFGWGKTVPVTLSYANHSPQTIKDFSLYMEIDNKEYFDINNLDQYSWSGTQVLPGSSKEINFDLPIKSSLKAAKNNYSQAHAVIRILAKGRFLNKQKQWVIQGDSIELKINTDLKFSALSRYYDDERAAIGRGALPPQVGQETHYWIFWQFRNTTNPVENILVKTHLPKWVDWIGETKTTHGLVLYDEDKHEVVWQISKLPVYVGGAYSLVEAGFEVSLRPEQSQIGLILPLTEYIDMSAQDQFTNNLIFYQAGFLDTNLKDDPVAHGLGMVIKKEAGT